MQTPTHVAITLEDANLLRRWLQEITLPRNLTDAPMGILQRAKPLFFEEPAPTPPPEGEPAPPPEVPLAAVSDEQAEKTGSDEA